MKLTKGKRYWFSSGWNIYSGLYCGEFNRVTKTAILHRRNGDVWSIPVEDIYDSEAKALKNNKGQKVLD